MATIEIHAAELNRVPTLLRDTRRSVLDYKSEIDALASRLITVSCEGSELDDVISSLRQSSRTQDLMASSLESNALRIERFTAEVSQIDRTAADLIRKRKQEFYNEHYYLKPESEKNFFEKWSDFTDSAVEWCMDHWKEILLTAVTIVGAVLSIIAVVASGGLALVPLVGSMGLSVSAASAVSMAVAVIAVSSTVISSVMSIMDMWGDFSGNSTFQAWKSAMGWVAAGSNLLYSIGNMYNLANGISPTDYIAQQEPVKNIVAVDSEIIELPNATDLTYTQTVQSHTAKLVTRGPFRGEPARPYMDQVQVIDEIMKGGTPTKDLFLTNGLRWDIPGYFRGSAGYWQLVIDLDTNRIVHFLFTD